LNQIVFSFVFEVYRLLRLLVLYLCLPFWRTVVIVHEWKLNKSIEELIDAKRELYVIARPGFTHHVNAISNDTCPFFIKEDNVAIGTRFGSGGPPV
jgi:hypothetical protein